MAIQFDLPKEYDSIIKVIGIGGGGSNAVNHMYNQGIVGVNFMVCNTDHQSLEQSAVPTQVQLGPGLTDGRGAGSKPEVGKNATLESIDEIKQSLGANTKMVFITAGMGGGTGTGGAPIVAKAARELGILTVGIVTTPFNFEGRKRIMQAHKGIEEIKQSVDTLIVISNDKLREQYGNLSLSDAFAKADDILTTAAKGIAEIITVPGYVNVDFEDVNTVMKDSGVAIMGTGVASGDDRALKAVQLALASPLLNDNDISGAEHILLNITSGTKEVLMDEVSDITNYIQEAAGYTSEVIWGNGTDDTLEEKISVTVIATGFESKFEKNGLPKVQEKVVLSLDDPPMNHHSTNGNGHVHNQMPVQEEKPVIQEPTYKRRETITFDLEEKEAPIFKQKETPTYQKKVEEKPMEYYNKYNRTYKKRNEEEEKMKVFMERKKRLRGLSLKLQSANLRELENEPAYKRRNITLEDTPHSSENNVSKYNLVDDENKKAEIKKGNTFLHGNVD